MTDLFIHHKWEGMREWILGSGFSGANSRERILTLANLIGSDRSHDKWERMRERILRSGCGSRFSGADFKPCDLSEPIRLGSGCGRGCGSGFSGADAGADAGADTNFSKSDWLRQIT